MVKFSIKIREVSMFKTQNYDDIADKPAEVLAKSHTSDTDFYSFVDDFHNQIRKITENTLEKTIAKTYGINREQYYCKKCKKVIYPLDIKLKLVEKKFHHQPIRYFLWMEDVAK